MARLAVNKHEVVPSSTRDDQDLCLLEICYAERAVRGEEEGENYSRREDEEMTKTVEGRKLRK